MILDNLSYACTAILNAISAAADVDTRDDIYRVTYIATDPVTSATRNATRDAIWAAVDPILR